MSQIVVETQGLSMRFGGVTAVDNVDFQLRAGELRCLIGPNGAGKSTFFKCLTGLLRPTEGEVMIRGETTTGFDPHRIARLGVGIKTQVPSVMDGLTVAENVWISAQRVHSAPEARLAVEEMIERFDLGDIAERTVDRLAHGERQRVELATVLAAKPWLVLLDEPAAGMTAEEVERMSAIIRDINRHAALIIVEHDMQFIRAIADRVTVFYQGAVLVDDQVDRVLADRRVRDVYLGKKA
ncbi:ABC transporter ATP-binding protein [Oceanibacterium hippocampi]|uniref:Lipopolysaccharide export system ATP-binding protein LptB n=1 Tax=Oceanibacterium hippocampi TaxID=745714 RepID=A0A1Y5TCV9_9PROT|nr:ABC transporter ATP-binding protein [Oceanibacterium hippocampi]SLN60848.1 Lipopolysaccharide export system ATP-binding protein LptB [Oceanibacterium hippocampi]